MEFKRKKGFQAIVAMDSNKGIGIENRLPWFIPKDLKWFKEKTINKPVIMGRLTAESMHWKPLPKRDNYILTKKTVEEIPSGWFKYNESLKDELISKEAFIIGGMQIYKLFWDEIETFWVTEIDHKFSVDTIFDLEFFDVEWKKELIHQYEKTEQNDYPIKIFKYSRRNLIYFS